VRKALVVVLCVCVLLITGSLVQMRAQSVTLVNGNFDGAFTIRGAGEVVVAEGWDPFYIEGDDRECPSPCHRPEYKPETVIAISGKSQRWFVTFSRQFAGVLQSGVNVQAGKWYEFSCDVYNISEKDGRLEVFAGINPWNAGPLHRTMIWGKGEVYPYRMWKRVTVQAEAWSDKITVAIGANNDWATQNNAAYVDNCMIEEVEGGSVVTPTPYPTYTLYPTCTPYPTWTPAPTVTPCPTGEPGVGCDYERIKADVATVVADREPVRWP